MFLRSVFMMLLFIILALVLSTVTSVYNWQFWAVHVIALALTLTPLINDY